MHHNSPQTSLCANLGTLSCLGLVSIVRPPASMEVLNLTSSTLGDKHLLSDRWPDLLQLAFVLIQVSLQLLWRLDFHSCGAACLSDQQQRRAMW